MIEPTFANTLGSIQTSHRISALTGYSVTCLAIRRALGLVDCAEVYQEAGEGDPFPDGFKV